MVFIVCYFIDCSSILGLGARSLEPQENYKADNQALTAEIFADPKNNQTDCDFDFDQNSGLLTIEKNQRMVKIQTEKMYQKEKGWRKYDVSYFDQTEHANDRYSQVAQILPTLRVHGNSILSGTVNRLELEEFQDIQACHETEVARNGRRRRYYRNGDLELKKRPCNRFKPGQFEISVRNRKIIECQPRRP